MQFYDATNKRAICQEIDRLCDTTDSTYPRVDKTARVNDANEEVVTWIITADGTFQFDDDNNTTLPRGVGTLLEGVAQYSFATKFLDIISVEVMDLNGLYRLIDPLDPSELGGLGWDEYFGLTNGSASTGFPRGYDKTADGLRLGPAPGAGFVTLTNGIRVTFQRTASLFTVATDTSDDTTEPGFASPFHKVLAYMGSLPYCASYKKDRVAWLEKEIGNFPQPSGMKKAILDFYSLREKDKRKQMTTKPIRGSFQ